MHWFWRWGSHSHQATRREIPLLLCTLCIALVLCASILGNSHETEQTIIARGDHAYPPFEYINRMGNPDGFTVDLITAIAEEIDLDVNISLGPWSTVRREIEEGEIDLLLGMFITPARAEDVHFSPPTISISHAVYIRSGSPITGIDDLAGRAILIQEGDVVHDVVEEKSMADTVILRQDMGDVLRDLAAGQGGCGHCCVSAGESFYCGRKSYLSSPCGRADFTKRVRHGRCMG
ncbi:transporter substrate-binding domain-containing protein [Chitinivibrio alkaliphilus]|uniref:Solute-binding protein family 3/N-terminal domain-containing protein n=1 Tax=Chitinivibrio alkaliphilus ACht1 TaxID=1313304 RepID=U7DBJ6_9BACT|nr:transporter substrate-binding domain-containing protein [Chitinivibrio alkaliphilus]ERP39397.1 hypothetical protein CALK_0199 [Chitinivibrio alkaliphilus ACht1]